MTSKLLQQLSWVWPRSGHPSDNVTAPSLSSKLRPRFTYPSTPQTSIRRRWAATCSREFRSNAILLGVNPKDKATRRYASGVERALSTFESTAQQEWADYISFLGRLMKALQAHPSPSEARFIPESVTVADRLAQCLNPNLPSGVHQKALEVYTYVFKTIGVCWDAGCDVFRIWAN